MRVLYHIFESMDIRHCAKCNVRLSKSYSLEGDKPRCPHCFCEYLSKGMYNVTELGGLR